MRLGLLFVALAAITWGTTGAALARLGVSGNAAPILVGAERFLVAAPLLLVAARVLRPWRQPRGIGFALAGLGMASFQICYFSAVPRAGVAVSALLSICSAPVFIALLARVILGEPVTRHRAVALSVGVVGAVLLVVDAGPALGPEFGLGALLAVGAGFSYSLYAVLTKRALPGTDQFTLTALTFTVAALCLMPFVVAQPGQAIDLAWTAGPTILYLGIVPTALAYILFSTGLRRVPASAAAIAGLLEPLTATGLGAIVFGEQFGLIGVIGAILLLGAVIATGTKPGAQSRTQCATM